MQLFGQFYLSLMRSFSLNAPIASLNENGERGMAIHELAKNKLFWILFLMMICAGASEQGVSQWASAFAEKGWCYQNSRRPCRTYGFCVPYGYFKSVLRQIRLIKLSLISL